MSGYVLSNRALKEIIKGKAAFITTCVPEGIDCGENGQVQPASLDLTIGSHVYGMGAASLPRAGVSIEEHVTSCQYKFTHEPEEESFLHPRYTYIVPLNEQIALPKGFSAKFSPKSSIGRTDVFVRVLADGVPRFDYVPEGYKGRLWLEITPLSFPVLIRAGMSFVQMRVRTGDARLSREDIVQAHVREGILFHKNGDPISAHDLNLTEHGLYMHVDLDRDIVGFVARDSGTSPLALFDIEKHDPQEFWIPIPRPRNGLTLDPDRFYLLATQERARIPAGTCGDIAPYDASTGEFRTHYAGFFDPGFGLDTGITGVLEVRGREMPHRLYSGDPICLMDFERVTEGDSYAGHYQNRGPSLSKHFLDRYEAWGF